MVKIYLRENQFNSLFNLREGATYTPNPDLHNGFNFQIDSNQDDESNKDVDTRMFGSKNAILNGDGTRNSVAYNLTKKRDSNKYAEYAYQGLIKWVENGRKGNPKFLSEKNTTTTTILKWINQGFSDEKLISKAKANLEKFAFRREVLYNKYDRVSDSFSNKIARYELFNVPGTNVKGIALFNMNDFNFSDAIKHGELRQNGGTDSKLGINTKQRGKEDSGELKKLPITYDGNETPSIESNFSLNNVQPMHYTSQYGMNGENIGQGKMTSVGKFINKSVMYASYVLNENNFNPDFIVSCPSSSSFNKFYCQRLSQKIGVPYVEDFFKRDVVNVYVDGKDVDYLIEKGFTESEVFNFQDQVKKVVFREIGYILTIPIQKLIQSSNIQVPMVAQVGRPGKDAEKVPEHHVISELYKYIFDFIMNNYDTDVIDRRIITSFLNSKVTPNYGKKYTYGFDTSYMFRFVTNKIGKKRMGELINEIFVLMKRYNKQLQTGYKPRCTTNRPKIVDFEQRFRPYLKNMYVIADKNLSKNSELFSRYQNANFLVFDEDINSGGTLKNVVAALQNKIGNEPNRILALVNAYSSTSR